MISVGYFEDITMYQFMILEGGTVSDICTTRVVIDNNIYNYYQSKEAIIITDNIVYSKLHEPYCTIPLSMHLDLLDQSKKSGKVFYVKINGRVVNDTDYEFVNITRSLKLKKLFKSIKNG
jgi:hypothetical protein